MGKADCQLCAHPWIRVSGAEPEVFTLTNIHMTGRLSGVRTQIWGIPHGETEAQRARLGGC